MGRNHLTFLRTTASLAILLFAGCDNGPVKPVSKLAALRQAGYPVTLPELNA